MHALKTARTSYSKFLGALVCPAVGEGSVHQSRSHTSVSQENAVCDDDPVRLLVQSANLFRRHLFDGSCQHSSGGDVRLIFADNTQLLAHKDVLCSMSDIVAEDLKGQTGQLEHRVNNTSFPWRVFLTYAYPAFKAMQNRPDKEEIIGRARRIVDESYPFRNVLDLVLAASPWEPSCSSNEEFRLVCLLARFGMDVHRYSNAERTWILNRFADLICSKQFRYLGGYQSYYSRVAHVPDIEKLRSEDAREILAMLSKDRMISLFRRMLRNLTDADKTQEEPYIRIP